MGGWDVSSARRHYIARYRQLDALLAKARATVAAREMEVAE
ncbi:MAG: hypothetical protein NTZ14_16735 [Hyphomicrobiales bacterium]|nr:hypothetical protein [Hyphomicrobiales bacterium]